MNNPPNPSPRRLPWVFTIAWQIFISGVVFVADRRLLTPLFSFIRSHPGSDKLGHFILIGGMAFLLNLSLGVREVRWLGLGWLVGSVLVGTVFTLEEVSQIWIPSRTFDLLDLAGDYTGIPFFGWLAKRVAMRRGQL